MNVLCIGGLADGRRVVLPDGQTRYAVYERLPLSVDLDKTPDPIVHRIDHYNLFQVHPVTRAVVFALESLTPTQVMEMLMDGYRQEGLYEVNSE